MEILLSDENIDVNKVDVSKRPHMRPLNYAIEAENIDATKLLLARTDILVNVGDKDEIGSPLLSAVNIGKPKLVSLLLKHDQIDANQYSFKNLDTIALSR